MTAGKNHIHKDKTDSQTPEALDDDDSGGQMERRHYSQIRTMQELVESPMKR